MKLKKNKKKQEKKHRESFPRAKAKAKKFCLTTLLHTYIHMLQGYRIADIVLLFSSLSPLFVDYFLIIVAFGRLQPPAIVVGGRVLELIETKIK